MARRPADAAALLGERAAARRAALVGDRQRSVAARALSERRGVPDERLGCGSAAGSCEFARNAKRRMDLYAVAYTVVNRYIIV